MKKIFYAVWCCLTMLAFENAGAQCTGGRYTDTNTFANVTVTTDTYSTVYHQAVDIYQPAGDTAARRPLIILAHGGAFYTGTKTDDITITQLCHRMAKRGYVVASIDYRLTSLVNMIDSAMAIDEVIKALSDGKAAVRYFVLDARGANTYRIDTNLIFGGGNSAGAVLYMHLGYISNISETPNYIQAAMNSNGGFEGNSGNAIPGYTTKIKAVINLAGALNMSSFINMFDCPSVNAQGTTDNIVPYNCGHALSGSCPVTLCGMGVLEGVMTAKDVYHSTIIFPGQGHVPWSADTAMFNSVDSIVTKFLAEGFVCNNLAAVPGVKHQNAELNLFPNPVKEMVKINSSETISSITICDVTGKVIREFNGLHTNEYTVNTANMPSGVYLVKTSFVQGSDYMPVVRRIVVE
ncbi:MAG: T9SS type A sorting domain-containing protein [Bacteroidetes bacterium]|nr:T9SS type A sorting domain-containing protein [Bacteroidota bacterium]